MKQLKSNCEMCDYYLYDDEYDYYYCEMELDEDEMYDCVTGSIGDCHYFRFKAKSPIKQSGFFSQSKMFVLILLIFCNFILLYDKRFL